MKWSLLVGRFWGTEIRLHASMLLLIPYALLAFQPDGLAGTLRALVLIAAIFFFVAMHEMGHTLAARWYGIQVTSIILWPLGGFANLSRRPEKTWPDLVISAAGPLTNLLISIGLAALTALERVLETSQVFPSLTLFLWRYDIFAFLASLTVANLSLALFNLVPVFPLDGGQIARGLLKLVFGEKHADRIMLFFSLPLALLLTAAGVFTRDIVIVLTGFLLLLASSTLDPRLLNNLVLAGLYFIDRAGFYLKKADFDPAAREYTRAIERSPERVGLYVSRAVTYMNLMENDRALADIEFALQKDPKHHVAWTLLGELLAMQKNPTAAMNAYNHAIELQPNWSIAYLDRGQIYQEQGLFPQALSDMDRAVELGRGAPVGYLLRSILRYEMGDLPGYRSDADQSLRYAPQWMLTFPEPFLLNMAGHLNWALDYYWRAIERMPNAYQVYQGRADACRVNQHPDWAIEDYHRAIHLAPQQAELYLSRGRAFQETGALDQARQDFAQAGRLAEKLRGKAHIRRLAEERIKEISPAGALSLATEQNEPAA